MVEGCFFLVGLIYVKLLISTESFAMVGKDKKFRWSLFVLPTCFFFTFRLLGTISLFFLGQWAFYTTKHYFLYLFSYLELAWIFAAYVQLVFMCFYFRFFFIFFFCVQEIVFRSLKCFRFFFFLLYSLKLSLNEKSMLALFLKEVEEKILMRF